MAPKRHQIKHLGFLLTPVRDQEVGGLKFHSPTSQTRLQGGLLKYEREAE